MPFVVTTILVAFSAAVLTGCTATAPVSLETPDASHASTAPTGNAPTSTPEPSPQWTTDTGECIPGVRIGFKRATDTEPMTAHLVGDLVDRGSVEGAASGVVGYDDSGRIESYTVAAGDSLSGIGQRFCVDEITVRQYNHIYPDVHPGDLLILRPDPSAEWVPEESAEG